MPSKLELLRMEIATYLVELEQLLPRDQWALTLVARHKNNEDSHICVSCDDERLVVAALQRLIDTTGELPPGELVAQAPRTK